MSEVIVQGLVLLGTIFILLAAIGVMRMPDLYMRMSTVTKGATLGVGLILAAVAVELYSTIVLLKVLAVLVFGFMTSPVAAHMISRAAYFQGVALWEGTVVDELKGQYEVRDHALTSPESGTTLAAAVLGEHAEHADERSE